MSFPESNFSELNGFEQQQILINNCRPYIDNEQFVVLGPGEIFRWNSNLSQLGFSDFLIDVEYYVEIQLTISNKIKDFCPTIWSGSISYNQKFRINSNY